MLSAEARSGFPQKEIISLEAALEFPSLETNTRVNRRQHDTSCLLQGSHALRKRVRLYAQYVELYKEALRSLDPGAQLNANSLGVD